MVPPIGAICAVMTNDLRTLVASLAKSDCLLQILPLSDIVTTNKVDPKEKKLHPLQLLLPTTPCIAVGQLRVVVVVVVINAPLPKIEP